MRPLCTPPFGSVPPRSDSAARISHTVNNKRACHLYATDGKPFLHSAIMLFLIDQPVNQVEGLDPIVGCVHARIQGEDDFLVIVLDLLQEASSRLWVSSFVMDSVT